MADNLKNTGKQDDIRINKNQSWEVRDWSKRLGVSEATLLKAIAAVGPLVKDVKKHLGK